MRTLMVLGVANQVIQLRGTRMVFQKFCDLRLKQSAHNGPIAIDGHIDGDRIGFGT